MARLSRKGKKLKSHRTCKEKYACEILRSGGGGRARRATLSHVTTVRVHDHSELAVCVRRDKGRAPVQARSDGQGEEIRDEEEMRRPTRLVHESLTAAAGGGGNKFKLKAKPTLLRASDSRRSTLLYGNGSESFIRVHRCC